MLHIQMHTGGDENNFGFHMNNSYFFNENILNNKYLLYYYKNYSYHSYKILYKNSF